MHRLRPILASAVLAVLAACSGGKSSSQPATDPPAAGQEVTVEVHPSSVWVQPGGTVNFASTVTGTADTSVAWAVVESGGGTISETGAYTAPLTSGTYTVTATNGKGKALGRAKVTVSPTPPPAVSISPSAGAVDACQTLTFTATVSGTTGGTVAWSIQEGSAGGSITSAGVYSAPAISGTYHVVATSQGATATVPVTVGDRILGVAVSPSTVSLAPGSTAQFTATVTTTCGSYTSTQTVTAPN